MADNTEFGTKILMVLLEKQIHIRNFLNELKKKYPDERGLTENGFRYSLKNGTMKISLLQKVSLQLGLPVTHWFSDALPHDLDDYKEANERLEARVEELEKDKENLQDLIDILKSQIKAK